MPSHLFRLFNYAKAVGAAALENFTTEALADAIRSDPTPMVAALHARGVEIPSDGLDVQTQVPLDDVGRLDLFLRPGSGRPVAVEVKVHHGESGDQIRRYREWAATRVDQHRPWIVTLSRQPISEHPDVVWLPWQHVRREALRSAATYWRDLAEFLVEHNMADDSDEPVTVAEGRVVDVAHQLLKKAALILVPAASAANRLWPGSNWPEGENRIRRSIAGRFATWPTYTIQNQSRYRAGITMGLCHESDTEDAWLAIWVWAKPNYVHERARIDAQTSTLQGEPWYREVGTWRPIGAYAPLAEFASHDVASEWLVARLSELEAAGLLALIPKLGAASPEEEDGLGAGETE